MHLATFLTFLESGRKKREIPCRNFVIKLLLVLHTTIQVVGKALIEPFPND